MAEFGPPAPTVAPGTGATEADGPAEVRGRGGWFADHPTTVDLVVVLAVFAYNLPIQLGSVPGGLWPGTGLVVSAGLCAPYIVRRRRPLGVFLGTLSVAVLQIVVGVDLLAADVMIVLALYNLATRARPLVSSTAALAVILWLVAAIAPTMRREHLSVGDAGVLIGIVAWAWTWGRLAQVRRSYIASLRERTVQLEREKAAEAAIAAAQERARIAREIHDIVSHSLSVVVVMSDGAAAQVEARPEDARRAMLTVRDTGRTALAEMRRMLGVLRDGEPGSHAPQPGTAQLPRLISDSLAAGLPVTFHDESADVPLATSVDLTVFRIVQEALTNVRAHAGPTVTEVHVRLRHDGGELEIRVSDDGRGAESESDAHGGHGLVGMRERVALHGGRLRAGPRPEGGYEVVAVLPTGGER